MPAFFWYLAVAFVWDCAIISASFLSECFRLSSLFFILNKAYKIGSTLLFEILFIKSFSPLSWKDFQTAEIYYTKC